MNINSSDTRIRTGLILISWAIIVSTLKGVYPSFDVPNSIINTSLGFGTGLVSGGLLKDIGGKNV